MSDTTATERGWLPDFIHTGGKFESGVAMFADASGITRFSREPEDLARAARMPGRAMLPGLVNVHSHTFQRLIRGRTEFRTPPPSRVGLEGAGGLGISPPLRVGLEGDRGVTPLAQRDTFWTWRVSMYRAANLVTPEAVYRAARMAFLEMALSGITTVGEFHYVHHGQGGVPYENRNLLALLILRAAEEVGIRIALLRTAYVRAGWKKDADPGQIRFIAPEAGDFLRDTDDLRKAVELKNGVAGLSSLGTEGRALVRRTQEAVPNLSPRAWVGVAPHSIRAVPIEYLREVAKYARAKGMPLHMHVAEQPAEIEACVGEHGRRPVELLDHEGVLDPRHEGKFGLPRPDGRGWTESRGLPRPDGTGETESHGLPRPDGTGETESHDLPRPDGTGETESHDLPRPDGPGETESHDLPRPDGTGFTAIHAIHITQEEAGMLGHAKASVCACPTSERNLGDGAVPADLLYDAGAALCFGSDSNIQIDILEDARELEYHLRMNKLERVVLAPNEEVDSLARRLFASATESGARSLWSPGGSLEVGKAADFFTVDLNDASLAGADEKSLLNTIVFSLERTAIRDVCVAGEWVIRDGRHRLQDEIVAEFVAAQRELWKDA